jgi:hypothetical protein
MGGWISLKNVVNRLNLLFRDHRTFGVPHENVQG